MPVAPQHITDLQPNQIFVFGSNTAGRHGKGAAKTARARFGARQGVAEGLTGHCYAIPTRRYVGVYKPLETLPLTRILCSVDTFVKYARAHPELQFLMTPIGTGEAGYSSGQIAELFRLSGQLPDNIFLPATFSIYLHAPIPPDELCAT